MSDNWDAGRCRCLRERPCITEQSSPKGVFREGNKLPEGWSPEPEAAGPPAPQPLLRENSGLREQEGRPGLAGNRQHSGLGVFAEFS